MLERILGCDFPAPIEYGCGLEGCAVYLDDIVISSSMCEKHLVCIKKLFDRLGEARLLSNLAKCEFAEA